MISVIAQSICSQTETSITFFWKSSKGKKHDWSYMMKIDNIYGMKMILVPIIYNKVDVLCLNGISPIEGKSHGDLR